MRTTASLVSMNEQVVEVSAWDNGAQSERLTDVAGNFLIKDMSGNPDYVFAGSLVQRNNQQVFDWMPKKNGLHECLEALTKQNIAGVDLLRNNQLTIGSVYPNHMIIDAHCTGCQGLHRNLGQLYTHLSHTTSHPCSRCYLRQTGSMRQLS